MTVTPLIPYFLSLGFVVMGMALGSSQGSDRGRNFSWAWSYGTGSVLFIYGLFLANVFEIRLSRLMVVGIFIFFSIAAALYRFRSHPLSFRSLEARLFPHCFSWAAIGAVFLISLVAIGAWLQAMALPLYHLDAVMQFGLDAKILFHEGTFRTAHFMERGIIHASPDYPLWVPYLQSTVYWLAGRVDDSLVRIPFVILWLALIALIHDRLKERTAAPLRWLLLTLFSTLPIFLYDDDAQIVSGCADLALSFFWTGTLLSAVRYVERHDKRWLLTMSLFSVGCFFSKPNGLPLCVIAWGILFFQTGGTPWPWALGTFLASLPWLWIHHQLPRDATLPPLTLANLSWIRIVSRGPDLLTGTVREFLGLRFWGMFWPLVGWGILFYRPKNAGQRLLGLALSAQVLLYAGFFLIEPRPIDWLLTASLPRFLLHAAPLTLLLASEHWAGNTTSASGTREPSSL